MRKTQTRQAAWILTPPLLVFCAIYLVWTQWAHDRLVQYALSQIPRVNQMQDQVELTVSDLDFSLLKLQAKANDIKVTFKNDFNYLETARIDNIRLQVDPFNLLIGQISASYIRIESLRWDLSEKAYRKIFNAPSGPTPVLNLEPLFKVLPDIPIQNIYLANSWLKLDLPESNDHALDLAQLNIVSLQIANQKKTLEILGTQINLSATSNKNISTEVKSNVYAKLDVNSIKKLTVDLIKNSSSLRIEASSDQIRNLLTNPYFNGQVKGQLHLDDIRHTAYIAKNSNSRIPQVTGSINFSGEIKSRGLNKNEGSMTLKYLDVSVDALKFGSGQLVSQIKNNILDINSVQIEHPSGLAQIKNINLENKSPYNFKADIIVTDFSLQKFFTSINETNIPAYVTIKGTATCQGQIENFSAQCSGDLTASDVDVYPDMKKDLNIVSIKKISATATAQIDLKQVDFKTLLKLNESSVQAEGKVIFDEGFNMNFKTDGLNLNDIANVAELKLKGIAKGTLKTSGNTDFGLIDAELNISQASMDDFVLGDLSTPLSYRAGVIHLPRLEGQMGMSLYSGGIEVNVDKKTTRGDFKFTQLKVTDGLAMIEEKWHLPIDATGMGTAQVSFYGPLDFWKLNTRINASLVKGTLYGESFSKLNVNIESNGQQMQFKDVRMTKTTGWIELSDFIDTAGKDPQMNLKITSRNLKADDIDHLNTYFKNASGDLQINGQIIGPLENARIITQNQLNNFQLGGVQLPSSQFESELNKRFFRAQGQVFGRQIQADVKIPLVENEGFILKAKLSDFQPLLLLPLLDLPIPEYDVKSTLTANLDLSTPTNQFQNLNGKISVSQFSLERGSQILKLTQPSDITYRGQITSMTPFVLSGPDQNLSFRLRTHQGEQKVFASGRLFLKPLQFLAPFTETLSGIMEFSTYIDFKNGRPHFAGEGLVNDASFSTKGFPYPVTNTSAFFDLYGSQIEFSEISAILNQARLMGQGLVDIQGSKNIKVDIAIDSEELELEFPKKIATSGIAKVKFYGNWVPYTLKIDYDIFQGLITKEFSKDEDDSAMVLQPNSFLPLSQLQSNSQSLLFDVSSRFPKGIVIKNSLVEGVLTGFINLTGHPDAPIMTGVVNVQPGSKLIFKDKPFEIQTGLVKFNGTKDINPDIEVVANARVTDYDINLNIIGPAKKLEIKATSQPALSDNDIFSLLALGYTSSSTDQNLTNQSILTSDTQQAQTGLEVLSVIGNQSEFSKKIQSRLGLNVQLAPSVDNTRNIAVPKVIVSKQLSKKVNTSYSRSLTGDRQNNEVKLQWLFRPDTSVILNYQNQPNIQENNILNTQESEAGVGGFDIEFKKEFD